MKDRVEVITIDDIRSEEEVQTIPEKKLVIEYFAGIPKFNFCGAWTGRDITDISRLVNREYHKYTRSLNKIGGIR